MTKTNVCFCRFINSKETVASVKSNDDSEVLNALDVLSEGSSLEQDLDDSGIMGGWSDRQTEDV